MVTFWWLSKYPAGILLFFLFHLIAIPIYSQQPSRHFLDIFERETQATRQESQFGNFRNIKHISYFPDTLPVWFFESPHASENKHYSIGISDPDMAPEEAFRQAWHRAKILSTFTNKARFEYYRDVFTSDQLQTGRHYMQRFDTFFRITADCFADSASFTLIDSHFTRYNESIVLVAYSSPGVKPETQLPSLNLSATASVLFIEARIGDAFEPQASYDLETEICSHTESLEVSHFSSIRKGNRSSTTSFWKDKEIDTPYFVYRYTNPTWEPLTRPFSSYRGLWASYLRHLLEFVALSFEQSNVSLRTVSESTEPGARDLIREIASLNARLMISGLDFKPNEIVFDLTIEE